MERICSFRLINESSAPMPNTPVPTYTIVYYSGTAVANLLALDGVEVHAGATLTLCASAMTLQCASILSSIANIKFIIQTFVSQGDSVTRAYRKATSFAVPSLLQPLQLTSKPLKMQRMTHLPLPLQKSSSISSTSTPSPVKSQAK